MAHHLEVATDGRVAFAAREDAWHHLGTVTHEAMTAAQALQLAHLHGWRVRKVPMMTAGSEDPSDTALDIPGSYATVRTNPFTRAPEVLGVVGEAYQPIQNEQNCEILDALVDASGAHFETAGSLKGGREVFVTMQLPEHLMVGGVDRVDLNIAALNSHDGSTAFRLVVTPVRVVCANTQTVALREAVSSFSIRHTRNAAGAIEQARNALGLTFKFHEAFQAEAEKMIQETMTEGQFERIVTGLFGEVSETAPAIQKTNAARRSRQLHQLFAESATTTQIRGTRWAGFQAITEYIDHYAPARRTRWSTQEATSRAMRSIGTHGSDLRQRAFDLTRA